MLIDNLADIEFRLDSSQVTLKSVIEERLEKITNTYLSQLAAATKIVSERGQKSVIRRVAKDETS